MESKRPRLRSMRSDWGPKKKLGLAVSAGLHEPLKMLAELEGCSVAAWVERRIVACMGAAEQSGMFSPAEFEALFRARYGRPVSALAARKDALRRASARLRRARRAARGTRPEISVGGAEELAEAVEAADQASAEHQTTRADTDHEDLGALGAGREGVNDAPRTTSDRQVRQRSRK